MMVRLDDAHRHSFQPRTCAPRSVFGIAFLDLPDDNRDRRGVDVCLPHQGGRPLDVVRVDRVEELIDAIDGRELFEDEGPLEVRLVHRQLSSSRSPSPPSFFLSAVFGARSICFLGVQPDVKPSALNLNMRRPRSFGVTASTSTR
jgi:hypothetical protein